MYIIYTQLNKISKNLLNLNLPFNFEISRKNDSLELFDAKSGSKTVLLL